MQSRTIYLIRLALQDTFPTRGRQVLCIGYSLYKKEGKSKTSLCLLFFASISPFSVAPKFHCGF